MGNRMVDTGFIKDVLSAYLFNPLRTARNVEEVCVWAALHLPKYKLLYKDIKLAHKRFALPITYRKYGSGNELQANYTKLLNEIADKMVIDLNERI